MSVQLTPKETVLLFPLNFLSTVEFFLPHYLFRTQIAQQDVSSCCSNTHTLLLWKIFNTHDAATSIFRQEPIHSQGNFS